MPVKFQDYSIKVKAELNNVTRAWLHEQSSEIKSQAQRNCKMDDKGQLKATYANKVDEGEGKATIGSPLESAYWEEWGTGEYAAHGDGRKGWWVYIEGQKSQGGGQTYATQEEAERMAAYIRARYHKKAIATNGRKPNYTLENAFKTIEPHAIERLKALLGERMGKE